MQFASGGWVRELTVCEKCVDIDQTIERYRRIERTIMDEVTVNRLKELIADLDQQKASLHPPLR
jgi:hypothetical protein